MIYLLIIFTVLKNYEFLDTYLILNIFFRNLFIQKMRNLATHFFQGFLAFVSKTFYFSEAWNKSFPSFLNNIIHEYNDY